MTKTTSHKSYALLLAAFALTPFCANAQFGNFLQQLQKSLPSSGQQAPGGTPAFGGMGAAPKGGLMPSDQWCSQQVGVLGGMKVDTGLLATEFKVPELEALQDQFMAALRNDKISKTFPSARFFQASFETKKVRAIYDTFLAFPEPDTLAALIQISRASDQQEKADALMALAFLQLQAPNLAISPNRWRENLQGALGTEHFTSLVFKARMSAYGEYGPKNLSKTSLIPPEMEA